MPETTTTEQEPTFLCPHCEDEHESEDAAEECCTHACPTCSDRYEDEDEARHCCMYQCEECDSWHEYESDAEECCMYRCPECEELHSDSDDARRCCRRGGDPYYPTLARISAYTISVAASEQRPARLISIEQELTGGGAAVAAMLYDEGLSSENGVNDYSVQPSPKDIIVCEDGSLPSDGAEVKYSMFDLSRVTDSTKLSKAVTKIRQLHKDAGIVDVGMSAGMHIHAAAKDVEARVLEPVGITSLHELFSFGEDMIYGLAAAGWPRHRYSGEGNDYAKPIPKIAQKGKTPWKVARVMGSKYFGINFERLLGTVNRCNCGSVRFGAWSECECGAFDRATVEWRVFNTSTMPETIHAWVLFVSAVMALAHTHTPGALRDQSFRPSGATLPARMAERWTTLEWFLKEAPLNAQESDVIRAAAHRSPLMSKQS